MHTSTVVLLFLALFVFAKVAEGRDKIKEERYEGPSIEPPRIKEDALNERAVSGIVMSDGKLTVQYDQQDVHQTNFCQQCFNFWLNEDVDEDFHYRLVYFKFVELDSTGQPCCNIFCDADPSICKEHAIVSFPPSLVIASKPEEFKISYTGIYDSVGNGGCSPPGGDQKFCGNFKFSDEFIFNAGNVSVSSTHSVAVDASTKKTTIRMDTWPFAAGSKGMRIQLLTSITGVRAQAYRLFPENSPATSPHFNDFDSVGIETRTRMAMLRFSPVARLNGTQTGTPVSISGPYPHEYDLNARYFYVDVPPFVSVEYDFFAGVLFENFQGTANIYTASISLIVSALLMLLAL